MIQYPKVKFHHPGEGSEPAQHQVEIRIFTFDSQ